VSEDHEQDPKATDRLANLVRLWRAGNAARQGLHLAQAVKAGTLLVKGKVLFWITVVAGALLALFLATIAIAAFVGNMPIPPQCAGTGASAATLAPAGGTIVGASEYGGPGDPGTPSDHSSSGVALDGHIAFAELGLPSAGDPNPYDARNLGTALGYGKALPFHSTVQITANGRSVVAEKLDIGAGGPPVGDPPHQRDIDLWWQTAQALGVDPTGSGQWSGLVTVQLVNLPTTTLASHTGANPLDASTCNMTTNAAASASGSTIVQIAQSQLNVNDGGDYCSPYSHGRCEPWCSDFLTWVWQHAGIDIPDYPFSGNVYTWGQHNTQVLGPTATPAPGDAVEFGTGPQSSSTSVHVGIVENVFPDGEITVINGDFDHHVERSGPFQPAQAAANSGSGSPIYGYVVP
jgi:CHAP domain